MKYLIRFFFLLLTTMIITLGTLSLQPSKKTSSSSKRVVNIFCWGSYFPAETLSRFEEETGISVHCSLFSSNEEFLSKLSQANGKGYDLFICSDYAIQTLMENGYIKKYDPQKTPFKKRIAPYLLHRSYDKENVYSLPLSWEAFGIIVPKERGIEKCSLKEIFEKDQKKEKVVMTPDPIEAFVFAAHYLFGRTENLTSSELTEIQNLLKEQKHWVEAYTEYRSKDLVAYENCQAGILKTCFLSQLAEENPDISFLIPKEGIFTSIEHFTLSSEIEHEEETYCFLEFFYRPEIMAIQTERLSLFPSCPDALPYTKNLPILFLEVLKEIEEKQEFHFFSYPIPKDQIHEMWVETKT